MTKNIIVLDEFNNPTGATYPKRARGLVKSGRAEFIDDGTIRLRHSPSAKIEKSERTDDVMSNNAQTTEKIPDIKAVQANIEALKKTALEAAEDVKNEAGKAPAEVNAVSAEKIAAAITEKAGELISTLEKADTPEKVAAVVNMTNLLDDTVWESFKACTVESFGLADVAGAIKKLSSAPDAANFTAGIAQMYFDTVNHISAEVLSAKQIDG